MKERLFLLAVVCFFTALTAPAQTNSVSVFEREIKARYEKDKLVVSLPYNNANTKESNGQLYLSLTDREGSTYATATKSAPVVPETGRFEATIPLAGRNDLEDLMWDRLEYRLGINGETATGIVSLSQVMKGFFDLRALAVEQVFMGMSFPVRIRATESFTGKPVAGVTVSGLLHHDDDEDEDDDAPKSKVRKLNLSAKAITDADGYAELYYQLPSDIPLRDEELELELRGTKGGLETVVYEDLDVLQPRQSTFFILDKPLYQPGQKVQFRALVMQSTPSDSGYVVAPEREISLSIKDEQYLTIYKSKVKTSRFGIVSGEWSIPPDAKLGGYQLIAEDEDGEWRDTVNFRISRYELPNFVVQTKSDKPYYLPEDQIAEVTVNATYLFGKPVAAGNVRVVREESRSWNFDEQKWDVEEKEAFEGVADTDGKFVAKIPLAEFHKDLKNDESDKFSDRKFTAYFTDSSSNRTEQIRFDLRVSKRAVHVHLVDLPSNVNPRLPLTVPFKTLAADGSFCACSYSIRGRTTEPKAQAFVPLATGRADKNGNALVDLRLPKAITEGEGRLELEVEATDAENRSGVATDKISLDRKSDQIAIRTDKALYASGNAVRVKIESTDRDGDVFLDVLRNGSSLSRQRVKLVAGRADVVVPYSPGFKGVLEIVALLGVAEEDSRADARTKIVFPAPRALSLSAKTEKPEYRPGGEANLGFAVNGRNVRETALGVVILDRAVEERAATESRFGGQRAILEDFREFAGVGWSDMDRSKLDADVQRAARISLRGGGVGFEDFDTTYGRNLESLFSEYSKRQFAGVERKLRDEYAKTLQYPKDNSTLTATLAKLDVDFTSFRDPWGKPYRVRTTLNRENEYLEIVSDGADKTPDSPGGEQNDDYVAFKAGFPWFGATGKQISRAIDEYSESTGLLVRDREALKAALTKRGIDLDALKDPWGTPLRTEFSVNGINLEVRLRSAGEDRRFEQYRYDYRDLNIWAHLTPYFKKDSERIGSILNTHTSREKTFPRTEEQFKAILIAADIDFDALRDPYDRPYYLTYREIDRFADRVSIESVVQADGIRREVYVLTPVTQKLGIFTVRSTGEDGIRQPDEWRDWTIETFAGVISEQSKDDAKPRQIVPKTALTRGKSALFVLVKDANDAVVAEAKVKLKRRSDGVESDVKETDDEGGAVVDNIAAGAYDVTVDAVGFKRLVISDVRLLDAQITTVVAKLEVGSVSETVTIASETAVTVDVSDSKIQTTVTQRTLELLPKGTNFTSFLKVAPGVVSEPMAGDLQVSGQRESSEFIENFWERREPRDKPVDDDAPQTTPRVRQYFPETLLWIPELVTDKYGKAYVRFRLGDNVTTWNVYAVASDEKGRVGLAKTEFKTFQPFFVDLDAPKFLTVGDEIYLPSQVRNYTDTKQRVSVSMMREDWFRLLTEPLQNIEVAPGSTTNAVFGFRATNDVIEGKQRVSAVAQKDADAIEKTVTVRPDGEEIVRSESFLAHSNDATTVEFPSNAIPGTQKSVLTIYPNTIAQVADAMDGLLQRPYGCAEQTISSTYPNLMLIKLSRATNSNDALKAKAAKNLKKGYERLLGYQRADGGFGYWGPNSDTDIALTAYAIRFLIDATGDIEVDRDIVTKARDNLVKQQNPDGGFYVKYSWEKQTDTRRALMNTAYVARILGKVAAAKASSKESDAALAKALEFVKKNRIQIDEPYTLALFGLAAADAGMIDEVNATAEKLRSVAIREADRVYWNLETNTPFYGWGTAGRVETTALALQFLQRANEQRTTDNELISKAAMFLLKNKDRYGVWYSTQTTINVLDGFLAAFGTTSEGTIRVRANDREIAAVEVNADTIAPVRIELPTGGPVAVQIDSGGREQMVLAQIVQTHHVSWNESASANMNVNQSRAVRLDYTCDKTSPAVSETVTCKVEAERIGFRGYGMLLAEIGVPPGAEVSRESLDEALGDANGLSQYEIHPDRIVLYMWATPGGTKFGFTFKPRYKVNAQTPASVLYDYYNEEAKATVRPMRFEVK